MFDANDKQMICAAVKGMKAEILASIGSTDAGTLGKQIDDLDPATTSDANMLAAYDSVRAYRLPAIDAAFTTAISELRASVTP